MSSRSSILSPRKNVEEFVKEEDKRSDLNTSSIRNSFDKLASAKSKITHKLGDAVVLREEFYPEDTAKKETESITIVTAFQRAVQKFPDHVALGFKNEFTSLYELWTFKEYYYKTLQTAYCLIKCGLMPGQGVGILGFNSPHWFLTFLGTIFAGGIVASIYPTNCPETCQLILERSKCNLLILEDGGQLQKIIPIWLHLPELKKVVQYRGQPFLKKNNIFSWDEFIENCKQNEVEIGQEELEKTLKKRWSDLAPNKCCDIIFTSGTTAQPKGAMISHDNLIWTGRTCGKVARLIPCQDILVTYLPLSHVAAQILDIIIPLLYGVTVYFAQPDALKGTLGKTLKEVKPTVFLGVPRVWEKIMDEIKRETNKLFFFNRFFFYISKKVGYHGNMSLMQGGTTPYYWNLFDYITFRKVKANLGFDRIKLCLSAAAPIGPETLNFFMGINLPIMEIYGMSESTGPHTISFPWQYRITSAGFNLPGVSTKISEENEICMYGRNVFMGYLGNEEQTKEAMDDSYWLKTGDIGEIKDGFLYITGRIKEILITAGGENVAPVPIEERLKAALNSVSQCMVVGDRKKFLSILITLKCEINKETMEPTDNLNQTTLDWLASLGVPSDINTVTKVINSHHPKINENLETCLEIINYEACSNAQKIHKYLILPRDFSIPHGELGPTLKLKRNVVLEMYKNEIDKLYLD